MSVDDFRNALRGDIAAILARIQNRYSVTEDDFAVALYSSAKKYLPHLFGDSAVDLKNDGKSELKEFIASLNSEDLCLGLACAKGDDKAWEDFYRDYRGYLINISRTMTQDAGAAEQLADSTFAELYGLRESEGQRISK